MKKFINILAVMAVLLGVTTSCEDFLQKDPLTSPSQSIFWKKKSDFDAALAGCYSIMYSGVISQIIPCYDCLTDNALCQHPEAAYGNTFSMALGDITSYTAGFISDVYSVCYRGISRVHLFLDNLEKYEGGDVSESDRNFYISQCKALRGYFYSWLYLCYREVPLVTQSLTIDNMYQEKASRADIYNQIMKDFDEAIANLPDKLYSDAEVNGYFTSSAVKGLKARILLNDAYDENGNPSDTGKFKEVVSSLESIEGYSLASSLRENFLTDRQSSSPEIMFSVRYLRPNIRNAMNTYYGSWAAIMVTRDLVDEYECNDGLKWGESPLTEEVDDDLLLLYASDEGATEAVKLFKNRDPRLALSICYGDHLSFPDEGFGIVPQPIHNPSFTGFIPVKLLQPTKEMKEYNVISDADVIILRYAEILLMIAEAENEANGPSPKAYDAVNAVRERSLMPDLPTGLTKEQMRERIRHEWRVEFAFEGHRYFQLKRWKLMEEKVNGAIEPAWSGYEKVFKPAFYFWPIPQREIDKAKGILTQDPNY